MVVAIVRGLVLKMQPKCCNSSGLPLAFAVRTSMRSLRCVCAVVGKIRLFIRLFCLHLAGSPYSLGPPPSEY